jgi:ligand-binding sensor domain-containing protein
MSRSFKRAMYGEWTFWLCGVLVTAVAFGQQPEPAPPAAESQPADVSDDELPFVYTDWQHFSTKDGLPNDHIFAIKADGPNVWIGTEDGLACLEKRTGKIQAWKEEDGLPFQVVSALDVDPKTRDLWIGLFGGGLARFSGGRFDHFHQLNSGLVNDVIYGVAVEKNHIWAATTAGASRYNLITKKWDIYTEKNAPMEEIWNYGVSYDPSQGKIFLGIWGSGVLEFDTATERWQDYLDPDGEMEVELYRDDGIVHVIVTGTSGVNGVLWVSSYFGMCRYDGRHWRGYFEKETGLPSNFGNAVKGRSAHEAWYATDKGVGVVTDYPSDTWVTYTMDPETQRGRAVVTRNRKVLKTYDLERAIPHNYALWVEVDGDDIWVGTSKGLAWGKGAGYYPRLRSQAQLAAQANRPAEKE